jgi:hypothetical protein
MRPTPQYDLGIPARDVAWAIWVSMVAMPILFLGVVLALKEPSHEVHAAPAGVLGLLALATSGLGILLSRVLPKRIPMRQVGGKPHLTALTRLVVSWSLCEAVAIFPLVAYLVTHDVRLVAIFAVDVLVLLLTYPSRARFDDYMPREPGSQRVVN